MVLTEQGHDLTRVHIKEPEEPRHLIGEGNLRRVKGVARVFECLGDSHINNLNGLIQEAEQFGDRISDVPIRGANDDKRRRVEVRDPGALAEKFGAHRRSDTRPVWADLGQCRDDDAFDGARRHGAADHDPMRRRLPAASTKGGNKVGNGPAHEGKIGAAACC